MEKGQNTANGIERAKRETKEQMLKSIDAYYERFQSAKDGRLPSIDEIEKMWGEEKKELEQILSNATSRLAEPEAADCKKKLPGV